MKKVLLSCTLLLAIAMFSKVNAQCTPYNFQSNIKSLEVNGAVATATLDVSFDIKANNGNKYIFIHLWTGTDYANVSFNWGANGQKAPSMTDLNGPGGSHPTLYNLAIDNNAVPPIYKDKYVDGVTTLNKPSTGPWVQHLANGADSFVVKDIQVSFPSSKLQILGAIIQGAIWSSNASNYSSSTSIQCYLTGATFFADPVISGNSSCRNYSITIAHNSLAQGDILNASYSVYVDSNNDGQYSGTDIQVEGPTSFSVAATTPIGNYFTGSQTFSGILPILYKGMNLFVVLTSGPASMTKLISTFQCSTLPVSFKSFSVARSNQTVAIKWETAFEQNNRGFYVQRNVNGEWKDVAFVFSSAEGGNSDRLLSYAYNDPNNISSITYYRILQVDLDGKGKYSDIRAVKGLGQQTKLMLFPNPGTGGKINVLVGDEASPKNIIVYDATGRVVKSFRNIVDNNLLIDQLKPGIYNIQVTNLASQTTSSDKFIIKN
jgi:hypothetical protein